MSLRSVSLRQPFVVAAAAALMSGAAAAPSVFADTLSTPIAVPLIGTEGIAAPYPSRQVVVSRSGPTTTGPITIRLHAVTHPCPEDLAVLLVRNGTEKYLLMSHAGGCRPLQGTTISITAIATPVPDEQAPSPAYGASLGMGPSNYGTAPVFPAPAPAGPYVNGMPPSSALVEGTWDLYVMDTRAAGGRGTIAAGWSLGYATRITRPAGQINVFLPSFLTQGPAGAYPMTFDLNDIPSDVRVASVEARVTLSHTNPDDIQLALQSPSGTVVVLMANAGGDIDLPAGTELRFTDQAQSRLLDDGPTTTGFWRPTVFFPLDFGPSGPAPPYQGALSAFDAEPARGTWRLWAFDDAAGGTGVISSAQLRLETETQPDIRLVAPPATATQPFVRLRAVDATTSPRARQWRVTNGGAFSDAGPFLPDPETTNGFVADVPLRQGVNQITYQSLNTGDASSSAVVDVTVSEFTYAFAEGATGGFFDLDLTFANPTGGAAPIRMDFLPEGGVPVTVTDSVPANAPFQFSVDTVVNGAVSSVIHSTSAVPLAAERTMTWDATGYGGHGGSSASPSTKWLFAEGSQGFFDTFILLANDNATETAVALQFLLEGGSVVTVPVTVPARSRKTIYAGDDPRLVNRSFSLDIDSVLPIIAERAMYLPGPRLFEGGHESAGVTETSREWFLAEGATGSFFDCFVLLGNPNAGDAHATVTYLLPSGATIVRRKTIPAHSRLTINVETEDPALANADVSTTIVSDLGIVAERAMYWPNISQGWHEAHNSFGVTASALHWGLADGRIGGPRGYQTFVLLANPNSFPAEVEVRFLKAGSAAATRSYVLAPSSRRSILVNSEVPELGEGVFGVDVQVQNFQPIAVEKALYWNSGAEIFAGGTNVTATRLPPP